MEFRIIWTLKTVEKQKNTRNSEEFRVFLMAENEGFEFEQAKHFFNKS